MCDDDGWCIFGSKVWFVAVNKTFFMTKAQKEEQKRLEEEKEAERWL